MEYVILYGYSLSNSINCKTTEAAPLRPTHDMNNFSLFENLNFARTINVANGLAITIMNIDMAIAIPNTFGNLEGKITI